MSDARAKVAQEAQRRRALGKFVFELGLSLVKQDVSPEEMVKAQQWLRPEDLDMIVEERLVEQRCGYPLCKNNLKKSRRALMEKDLPDGFCGPSCAIALHAFRGKLSTEPVYLRKISLDIHQNVNLIEKPAEPLHESCNETSSTSPSDRHSEIEEEKFINKLLDEAAVQKRRMKLDCSLEGHKSNADPANEQESESVSFEDSSDNFGFDFSSLILDPQSLHEEAEQMRSQLSPFAILLQMISSWEITAEGEIAPVNQPNSPLPESESSKIVEHMDTIQTERRILLLRNVLNRLDQVLNQCGVSLDLQPTIIRFVPGILNSLFIRDPIPALSSRQWNMLCLVIFRAYCKHSSAHEQNFSDSRMCSFLEKTGFDHDHLDVLVCSFPKFPIKD